MKTKLNNRGIRFFMAFALLFISYSLTAQYSYQSVVRDGNGDLVANQSIGLKVKIYEKNVFGGGTTDVYEETHTVTTNDNGLVSLTIGDGTAISGSMNDIEWSGMVVNGGITYVFTNHIEVKYDLNGGTNYTLTTNEEVKQVPTATFAQEAREADNGAIAYATIDDDGTIKKSKGVESVTWNSTYNAYIIELENITYSVADYVTLVTPVGVYASATMDSTAGKLWIKIYDSSNNSTQRDFQFVVFDPSN